MNCSPMKRRMLRYAALAVFPLVPGLALADWTLEPSHTHVSFEVGHLGLTQTPGVFRKFDSTVRFDDRDIANSQITLSIDAASVDTLEPTRDAALRGPDWFDAEKYPKITFASRSVKSIDATNFSIAGDLTVHGKTVPVVFNARLTNRIVNPFLKVPAVGFVATARVDRTAFGMTQYLPVVGSEVALKIQAELNKIP